MVASVMTFNPAIRLAGSRRSPIFPYSNGSSFGLAISARISVRNVSVLEAVQVGPEPKAPFELVLQDADL
jgi:hypothetical protein